MDQNNQYQSPSEQYAPVNVQEPTVVPSVDQMVEELSNKAFKKGLLSAIFSLWPILSIVAIVLGCQSLKLVKKAKELAEPYGIFAGGKYIAARVLALVGKFTGILMTVVWGIYLIAIIVMLVSFYIAFIRGGI